jgi:hypothetical protein
MLDLDCFIAECRAAVSLDPIHKSVREIVARAVSEPAAVIADDNIFWRRLPGQDGARIEAAGAKSLGERDVEALGRDIIHTVINPLPRLTGAIHVYGGDSSFAALAANGIRKRCSNNRSTWRKT